LGAPHNGLVNRVRKKLPGKVAALHV